MQTTSPPKVLIKEPCNQHWGSMMPGKEGRFCQQCTKTVNDFTRYTDAELQAYFASKPEGKFCGRFRAGQVMTPRMKSTRSNSFKNTWRYLTLGLISFLFSKTAGAQQSETVALNRDAEKLPPASNRFRNDSMIYLLQGTISEAGTGDPLEVAILTVQRGNEKASVGYTDSDGNYRMEVPSTNSPKPFTLVITKEHYKSKVIQNYTPSVDPQDFELKARLTRTGRPRHYHRRGLFHRRRGYHVMGAFAYGPSFMLVCSCMFI